MRQAPCPKTDKHDWQDYFHYFRCRKCKVLRRADDKNEPCPGEVRLGPDEWRRVERDSASRSSRARKAPRIPR